MQRTGTKQGQWRRPGRPRTWQQQTHLREERKVRLQQEVWLESTAPSAMGVEPGRGHRARGCTGPVWLQAQQPHHERPQGLLEPAAACSCLASRVLAPWPASLQARDWRFCPWVIHEHKAQAKIPTHQEFQCPSLV